MLSCVQCKEAGHPTLIPNDEIGVALMQQHLISEHGVRLVNPISHRQHSETPDDEGWWY